MVTTVQQALATAAPSLAALCRAEGSSRAKVFGLLQLHLMRISTYAKVKQPLTKVEVDLLATDILHDFPYLTFADITVIFRRFFHGEYGEFYGSITSGDIYQWFARYADERLDAAEQQTLAAERKRFSNAGGKSDIDILLGLGYKVDGDGRIVPSAEQKPAAAPQPQRLTSDEKEEAYKRWKQRYQTTGKLD